MDSTGALLGGRRGHAERGRAPIDPAATGDPALCDRYVHGRLPHAARERSSTINGIRRATRDVAWSSHDTDLAETVTVICARVEPQGAGQTETKRDSGAAGKYVCAAQTLSTRTSTFLSRHLVS